MEEEGGTGIGKEGEEGIMKEGEVQEEEVGRCGVEDSNIETL